ncbi:MAG: acyl carrier protein [Planctomycetaceae bacterium]
MPSPAEIEKAVRECLKIVKDDESLEPGLNDPFEDYDIDSLDQMSLALQVEQQTGINMEGIDPIQLNTIQKYIDKLQSA